jgi:hypothetical protein
LVGVIPVPVTRVLLAWFLPTHSHFQAESSFPIN